mgnify:CR=1 FL=1
MQNNLKKLFWKLYKFNNPDYKDNFYGSFDKMRLFLVNILKPGRLINRLRYGQIFKNSNKKIKTFNNLLDSDKFSEVSNEKKDKLRNGLNNLLQDGGCVIPNYFNEKEITNLKTKYDEVIKNIKKTDNEDNDQHNADIMPLSYDLLNIWLDKGLMNLLKIYHGRNIYARNYPFVIYSKVSKNYFEIEKNKKNKIRWAKNWHVDHSVLFNIHVVLDDIKSNCSRMQILKRSDKFNHYGSNFSEEIVEKSKLEKIDCIGSAGTVYLHSGNVVHRFNPVPGTDRLVTHFEFSPGSNILMHTKGIVKSLNNDFDLDNIDKENMNIIYPIYPKKLFKGYDVKGDSYNPTKFRGI